MLHDHWPMTAPLCIFVTIIFINLMSDKRFTSTYKENKKVVFVSWQQQKNKFKCKKRNTMFKQSHNESYHVKKTLSSLWGKILIIKGFLLPLPAIKSYTKNDSATDSQERYTYSKIIKYTNHQVRTNEKIHIINTVHHILFQCECATTYTEEFCHYTI